MNSTIINRVLGYFSNEKYPHVSIILNENKKMSYSFGRKFWYFPFIGGFIEESPNDSFHQRFPTYCEIYSLNISNITYTKIKRRIKEIRKNNANYGYNYFGLFYSFFMIPQELDKRYTCTQFVASLLNLDNTIRFSKDMSLIRAKDYRELSDIKLVYQGLYNNAFDILEKKVLT